MSATGASARGLHAAGRSAAVEPPAGSAVATRPEGSTSGKADGFGPRLTYLPGLDGIRAVSIMGIMAQHGGLAWATGGGIISVNVFFVLSGYLITTLLIKEWTKSGTILLRRFWARRARRLLPALFVLLFGIGLYAWFIAPSDTLGSLRTNGFATLFYFANWHNISSGQSYFAQQSVPSPLLHTWTLAIEEQFYLVWPLVVLGLLKWRRSLRPLLIVCVVGAVASAIEMALLFNPLSDPSRLYYGTDTRAQDLLVGAALAVLLARRSHATTARGKAAMSGVAFAGMLGFTLVWWHVQSSSSFPFEFGFFVADLMVALVILGIVQSPDGAAARLLGVRPLAALGKISYGLYLWHWPVFLTLDGERTGLQGYPLFAVRVAVSVVLAVLSYHLVEMPVRKGAFRSWRAWALTPVAVLATSLVLLVSTAGAAAPAASAPVSQRQSQVHHINDPGVGPATPVVPAGTKGPIRVLVVGDSEAAFLGFGLLGAANANGVQFTDDGVIGCGLLHGPTQLQGQLENKTVGIRGADTWVPCATQLIRWRADLDTYHPDVVLLLDGEFEVRNRLEHGRWLHLGDPVVDAQEKAAMVRAVDTLRSTGAAVVLLTAPYYGGSEAPDGAPWPEDDPARVNEYNRLLAEVAAQYPSGVTVLPFGSQVDPSGHYQAAIGNVEMRYSDGIHLTTAGAKLVAPWLMKHAAEIGRANRAASSTPATTTPPATSPPP